MQNFFHALFLSIFLWPPLAAHADFSVRLNESDKQAHAVVGFQTAYLLQRSLSLYGLSKRDSILIATASVGALALVKEKIFDSNFDRRDIYATMLGSFVGSGVFALLEQDSYSMEAEIGMLRYATRTWAKPNTAVPPFTTMIKAQTTFWFRDIWGVHLFSGGMDYTKKNGSGRRLNYGGGARVRLLSAGGVTEEGFPKFSLWAGADYGYLLLSSLKRKAAYVKSARTAFFTLGARLHLWRRMNLSTEGQFIPYAGNRVLGFGLGVGFDL